MIRSPLGVLALLLAAGCNPLSDSGTLSAHWTVPGDTAAASLSMPVTGRWCVGPSRLDIRAASGDTGLGIALYPSDSSAMAGTYTVLAPGGQLQVRPSAGVALRWVGKVLVQGWWGDSGTVTLSGGPVRGLSGSGAVSLVSGRDQDSAIALAFEFRGVRVQNDTLCDRPEVEASPDSSGTLTDDGVD